MFKFIIAVVFFTFFIRAANNDLPAKFQGAGTFLVEFTRALIDGNTDEQMTVESVDKEIYKPTLGYQL